MTTRDPYNDDSRHPGDLSLPLRTALLMPDVMAELKLILWGEDGPSVAQIQEVFEQVAEGGPNVILKDTSGFSFGDSSLSSDHRQWSEDKKIEAIWIVMAAISLEIDGDGERGGVADKATFMKVCGEQWRGWSFPLLKGRLTFSSLVSLLLAGIMKACVSMMQVANHQGRWHVEMVTDREWAYVVECYAAHKAGYKACCLYNRNNGMGHWSASGTTLEAEGVTSESDQYLRPHSPQWADIWPY